MNKQLRSIGWLLILVSSFSLTGCEWIRALIGGGATNKCSDSQICCIVQTGPNADSKVEQCVQNGEACLVLGNTFKGENGYPQAKTSNSTNVCVN